MPADVRIMTPPFNIVGAFALVFGAVYSAYIFMPKTRVMRVTTDLPVIGGIGRAAAVFVNFFASLPDDLARAARRDAELARAGDDPHRARRLHPRLDERPESVRHHLVVLHRRAGRGCVLIFLGFLVSIEVFSDVRLPFTRIVLRRRDAESRRPPDRPVAR